MKNLVKLEKEDISHLKSNKKLFNESKTQENLEKFKVSQSISKKSDKYIVQKAEEKEKTDLNHLNSSKLHGMSSRMGNDEGKNEQLNATGFSKLPPELASTFNKMIFQMDHIVK